MNSEDLVNIAREILAVTCVSLVENEDYLDLKRYLVVSQECIVDTFNSTIERFELDISNEVSQVSCWVSKAIEEINTLYEQSTNPNFSFNSLWEMNEQAAIREIHRCTGAGVSFWDDYNYQDHGFYSLPKTPYLESPYQPAMNVLEKLKIAILVRNDAKLACSTNNN